MLIREIPKISWFFFGAIALLPLWVDSPYVLGVLAVANIYAVWVMSWDIFSGYTGEINFGHAFLIGIGGFTAALLNKRLGLAPGMTIPIACFVTLSFALIVGALTLRLRGPYFSIITVALNIALEEMALVFWPWTGGEEGIPNLSPLSSGPIWDFYITLIFTFVVFFCLFLLSISRYGQILIAIRENEDTAAASGINIAAYRIIIFGLRGLIAGIGGGMFIHIQMHAGYDLLSLMLSAMILIMAIFGGIGTVIGPLFGAYLLYTLNEGLRNIEEYRMFVFTSVLLLTLFFFPNGIFNRLNNLIDQMTAHFSRKAK